jgi:hypothetical protein
VNLFMCPPGYGHPGPEIESLNALLRHELAAIRAYTHALGRFDGLACHEELRRIRVQHETAADVLRDHIRNLGGEPDEGFGPSDAFAGAATPEAGADALLGALKRGEERGLAGYEALLQTEEMPQECRFVVRGELLPHCHARIDALAGLLGGPKPKG